MSNSKEGVLQINIHDVRTDGGTQIREAIDDALVREYAEKLKEGHYFPDVIVFYDGTNYWLADGFHRVEAAKSAGHTTIDAEARPGTQRDALLHACGANDSHGLKRTRAEARRAIETLLRDEEWSKKSDSWVAQHCNVAHTTVGRIRKELESTCAMHKSTAREGADGRTINVRTIGHKQQDTKRGHASTLQRIPMPRRKKLPATEEDNERISLDIYQNATNPIVDTLDKMTCWDASVIMLEVCKRMPIMDLRDHLTELQTLFARRQDATAVAS